MSRGNGLDFVFTLSNATVDDSGAYEVVVEGTHPATSSLITIKKKFRLSVGMLLIIYNNILLLCLDYNNTGNVGVGFIGYS